jgi:two-component system, OmpR family, phosphate regulon sensor histidine kinase PhoR
LQKFVARTLAASEPVETDIVLRSGATTLLRAHGAVLRDATGTRIGAVVVLNDVTRVRRLETLRRDFVANVSHELKTPITSIKGFVETLIQDRPKDPAEAERFLQIIARHADRLTAIIEDLLLLSRIEQDQEGAQVEMQPWPMQDILQPAVQACEARAAERGMTIRLVCPDDLTVVLNAHLMEQAVLNLINNAVKYGDANTDIEVAAGREDASVFIRVSDHSPGIDEEQLPRLFERFYRVDKGRSRSEGGTGLGLAIVKHIAQVHRGAVLAESRRGVGSVFTIQLPAQPA